jgi:hypothetical protein
VSIDRLREDYEDSLFRYLMAGYSQEVGEELQTDNKNLRAAGEFDPSPEAVRRFDRALNSAFYKRVFINTVKKTYRSMNKAAVLIIAIVMLAGSSVLAIEGVRIGVLNFLIGFEQEYTSLRLDPERGNNIIGDNVYMSWSGGFVPAYIPDGYRIVNISSAGNVKSILFENDEGSFIHYSEDTADAVTHIDTENANTENVKVNNYDALLVTKNGVTSIAWSDGHRIFIIISMLERDELLKMAVNVILVE